MSKWEADFQRISREQALKAITRRHFFVESGFGIGAAALCALLNENLSAANPQGQAGDPLRTKAPHFSPRARSVIYLFMAGGPSQVDLFDYKPKLNELNGRKIPEEIIKGERFAFIKGVPALLGSPHTFKKHGKCGAELSSLLPHLAEVVDDIAIVKSLHTDHFNHAPAQIFMSTGHQQISKPSMGSWLTYGLGSENSDLPGFVVLASGTPGPDAGKSCWASGFFTRRLPGGGISVPGRSRAVPFTA